MKSLELKIPPLPLALLFAGLMWLIEFWMPANAERSHIRTAMALVIWVLAVAILAAAIFGFRKVRTTVDPIHPEAATVIVSTGVYGFTRNPMYLAFLLCLIAWAVYLGNLFAAPVPVAFVLYMNRFQICAEERALRARFGPPYEAYLRSVRRWV